MATASINPSYVSRVLRMTLLARDLVEAALAGWQPAGMTLASAIGAWPGDWEQQKSECRQRPPHTLGRVHKHRTAPLYATSGRCAPTGPPALPDAPGRRSTDRRCGVIAPLLANFRLPSVLGTRDRMLFVSPFGGRR